MHYKLTHDVIQCWNKAIQEHEATPDEPPADAMAELYSKHELYAKRSRPSKKVAAEKKIGHSNVSLQAIAAVAATVTPSSMPQYAQAMAPSPYPQFSQPALSQMPYFGQLGSSWSLPFMQPQMWLFYSQPITAFSSYPHLTHLDAVHRELARRFITP